MGGVVGTHKWREVHYGHVKTRTSCHINVVRLIFTGVPSVVFFYIDSYNFYIDFLDIYLWFSICQYFYQISTKIFLDIFTISLSRVLQFLQRYVWTYLRFSIWQDFYKDIFGHIYGFFVKSSRISTKIFLDTCTISPFVKTSVIFMDFIKFDFHFPSQSFLVLAPS